MKTRTDGILGSWACMTFNDSISAQLRNLNIYIALHIHQRYPPLYQDIPYSQHLHVTIGRPLTSKQTRFFVHWGVRQSDLDVTSEWIPTSATARRVATRGLQLSTALQTRRAAWPNDPFRSLRL